LYVLDTNDEPVLKKAIDINVGDYLVVPKPKKIMSHLNWFSYKGIEVAEESMGDLCYLCGLYLAEGYVDRRGYSTSFSFNINEKNTLGKKCKELMLKLFKINKKNIYDRELLDRNGYEITFHDKEIAEFFKVHFGTGSHDKFISYKFKFSASNIELLKGYWDGDGHIRKEGFKNKKLNKRRITPECSAETASLELALDLREVLLSSNIVPSLRKSIRKDGRVSYIFSISDDYFDRILSINNATRINSRHRKKFETVFGVLITKKEELFDYDDLVCSIAVDKTSDEAEENGGSYILNGVASSNSPWYRGDQLWAEPDVVDGGLKMQSVVDDKEAAIKKGKLLQQSIKDNFSWEAIAGRIIKELEEID